jgi:hypothetical protein
VLMDNSLDACEVAGIAPFIMESAKFVRLAQGVRCISVFLRERSVYEKKVDTDRRITLGNEYFARNRSSYNNSAGLAKRTSGRTPSRKGSACLYTRNSRLDQGTGQGPALAVPV